MNTLISVVIPTYNRASLIEDALNSVYAQTYRPLEVIVVDDGSTDTTKSVVDTWAKERCDQSLTVEFLEQENQGGNVARNTGIENATGDYIAFLDSDDAWLPEKLAEQISYFKNPKVGGVYCGVQHKNFETGSILEPSDRNYPTGELLEHLLVKDVTVQTSAYVVRTSVFKDVGNFDTSLQARQDWDMWIRLSSKYTIEAAPKVLVDFREHLGERTASNPQKEIDGYRAIRQKYSKLLKNQSLQCRLQASSAYYKRMGRVHFKHKLSKPKAFGYGMMAIISWPFDFDAYAALAGMFMPSDFRAKIHRAWNRVFGKTKLAIRSH
ncbi:MAG: glycosyltransferase family 2 protein [Opitutaceae bacterium]